MTLPVIRAVALHLSCSMLLVGGCYQGAGEGRVGDATDGVGDETEGEQSSTRCSADGLVRQRLRRLSDREYQSTVADLFPGLEVPRIRSPGTSPYEFVNIVDRFEVDGAVVSMYRHFAKDIAGAVVAQPSLFGCAAELTPACGADYVLDLATRAFRRPLEGDERARILGLYEELGTASVLEGVRGAIELILQSPSFLYRPELGAEPLDETVVLDPHELASAISFFLRGTGPDEELLAAAEAGDLATMQGRAAQVDRLLEDPRVQAHLTQELLYWIGVPAIEGSSGQIGLLEPEVKAALIEDVRAFVHETVWQGGSVADLLLSRHTDAVPAELADIYGVAPEATQLPETERAGLLTRPGVIASLPPGNRVVHRGKFLRTQLLCDTLPLPPATALEEAAQHEGLSMREQASLRAANPACNACHQLMDPPGFAFESYDELGRHLSERDGLPVDASGELVGTDVDGSFSDLIELSERLASSERVTTCITEQLTNFAFGALLDHSAAACGSQAEAPLVVTPRTEIRAVFRNIVMDPRFGQRAVIQEEGV